MGDYQPGIFDKSCSEQMFLEFLLASGSDPEGLRAALRRVAAIAPPSGTVTLAFGPALWRRLDGGFDFPGFHLEGQVPATQGDLLVWVQARNRSDAFDASMAVQDALAGLFGTQLEVPAFVYHDSRDLTGFVDGIGNPEGEAAQQAAIVPETHPGAGGSFLLTQKWVHDLASFKALSVAEQEKVIGRTRQDAVELDEKDMPVDAHVARTDVARDGVPQKIWRRSIAYGTTTENGLYFVGFSCELDRLDYLLRRMYGMVDDEIKDRLTSFSMPVMSSWWYVPTRGFLAAL